MLYSFVILPKANDEYYAALDWYALQDNSLPVKFALDVEVSINGILRNPESHQQFRKGFRQALMRNFPYFIIYAVDNKIGIVSIVSVFHTSRHPTKKFRK